MSAADLKVWLSGVRVSLRAESLLALRIGLLGALILMTLAACGGFAPESRPRSHQGPAANGVAASMEGAPVATMSVRIRNYAFHSSTTAVDVEPIATFLILNSALDDRRADRQTTAQSSCGGADVPTYLMLLRYTQTGIQNIKESPGSQEAAARQLARSLGGEIKAAYLTMGRYDSAVIFEAPDDETVAKFALAVGSRGAVSTETLRAFPEDDYRKIISELP